MISAARTKLGKTQHCTSAHEVTCFVTHSPGEARTLQRGRLKHASDNLNAALEGDLSLMNWTSERISRVRNWVQRAQTEIHAAQRGSELAEQSGGSGGGGGVEQGPRSPRLVYRHLIKPVLVDSALARYLSIIYRQALNAADLREVRLENFDWWWWFAPWLIDCAANGGMLSSLGSQPFESGVCVACLGLARRW